MSWQHRLRNALALAVGLMAPAAVAQGPIGSSSLFTHLGSLQVTPDAAFHVGSFARIHYVPATDRFLVTFGTVQDQVAGSCQGAGYAYKEYSVDLQPTGRAGYFLFYPGSCGAGDSASTMSGNSYYGAFVPQLPGQPPGWRLLKLDAVSVAVTAETFVPLNAPNEGDLDPTVAWVNEQLDVSDQYNPTGIWQEGAGSHHHFFTADLQPVGRKILADTALISGGSMIFVDGVYYIVTANGFTGDLVVAKYDRNWGYLGVRELRKQSHWSQGVAFDGRRFYVSYLDTSQRTPVTFFPFYPNVHLAAFDRDWNLVDDVAVTNYAVSDNKFPGRPWVILHGRRLYVSYDMAALDPVTHVERLETQQAFVSVYELPLVRRRAVRR